MKLLPAQAQPTFDFHSAIWTDPFGCSGVLGLGLQALGLNPNLKSHVLAIPPCPNRLRIKDWAWATELHSWGKDIRLVLGCFGLRGLGDCSSMGQLDSRTPKELASEWLLLKTRRAILHILHSSTRFPISSAVLTVASPRTAPGRWLLLQMHPQEPQPPAA